MTPEYQGGLLNKWIEQYENDPDFIAEGLSTDVIEEVMRILQEEGLNQSALAERMSVSRSRISKILTAPANLTMLSVASLAVALGVSPRIILDQSRYLIKLRTEEFSWEEYEAFVTDQAVQKVKKSDFDIRSTVSMYQPSNVRYPNAASPPPPLGT